MTSSQEPVLGLAELLVQIMRIQKEIEKVEVTRERRKLEERWVGPGEETPGSPA